MNDKTLQLFKTLTELPGPSGNEHAVRKFMREQLSQYSNEIVQDKLGSIFGVKRGMNLAEPLWWQVIWMKSGLWSHRLPTMA